MKTDEANSPHPSGELLKKLAALKAHVAEIPLSPSESIRLALDVEAKLSAFHMDQMHIFSDESTNSLFKSMMNNDNGHIEALKTAMAKLLQPPDGGCAELPGSAENT
jgi:rubrerythrin